MSIQDVKARYSAEIDDAQAAAILKAVEELQYWHEVAKKRSVQMPGSKIFVVLNEARNFYYCTEDYRHLYPKGTWVVAAYQAGKEVQI